MIPNTNPPTIAQRAPLHYVAEGDIFKENLLEKTEYAKFGLKNFLSKLSTDGICAHFFSSGNEREKKIGKRKVLSFLNY